MYFKNLPQHVKDAICKLPTDEEFQHRFGTDEVLDKLDDEAATPSNSFIELMAVSNRLLKIKDKYYKSITPLMWSFLWCIESPMCRQL